MGHRAQRRIGRFPSRVLEADRTVHYILTYMMGSAKQHRRRAKADVCFILFYRTYALARLRSHVIVLRWPYAFVHPSCKSIYRVYITKQAK